MEMIQMKLFTILGTKSVDLQSFLQISFIVKCFFPSKTSYFDSFALKTDKEIIKTEMNRCI